MAFNSDAYIQVHERVEKFYLTYQLGRIITSILEHDVETGFVLMKAEVFRDVSDAYPAATGHASELRSSGHVQQTNYIEVCETSAVGRALQNLGFETKRAVANGRPPAQAKAARAPQQQRQPPPPATPSPAVPLTTKREKLINRIEELRQQARDLKTPGLAPSDLDSSLDRADEKELTSLGLRLGDAVNLHANHRAAAEERERLKA